MRIFSSVLLALGLVAQPVPAQEEAPPLRVDVELVTLTATVTSRTGTYVGGLKKEDFRVYEDGVLQEIAVFESHQVPISLGILFDTSGSMVDKIDDVQDAVLHFIRTVNPQDEIFVLRFSSRVELVEEFTDDRARLERAVRRLRARGSTHLYDAIAEGLEIVQQGRRPKKALLLVTDGNDTESSIAFEEVLERAQKSEVLVYGMGIGHSERGSFGHAPRAFRDEVDMRVLNALAEETGGKSYHLEAAHRGGRDLIDEACQEVSTELRQQYLLAYYPKNTAQGGGYRRIRVETRNPGQVVRTRPGYYPPQKKVSGQPRRTGAEGVADGRLDTSGGTQ